MIFYTFYFFSNILEKMYEMYFVKFMKTYGKVQIWHIFKRGDSNSVGTRSNSV
jgi:hypothetical protein